MRLPIIVSLFLLSMFLIEMDHFTALEINHSAVYFILLFIATATFFLFMDQLLFRVKKVYLLIIICTIGVFCYAGFILRWGGEWCTQTIIYQNLHNKNRKIEFQMVDERAFGYGRRTIDRTKIIPFVDWTMEIQESEIDTSAWKKVDIEVNDIGLKGG